MKFVLLMSDFKMSCTQQRDRDELTGTAGVDGSESAGVVRNFFFPDPLGGLRFQITPATNMMEQELTLIFGYVNDILAPWRKVDS